MTSSNGVSEQIEQTYPQSAELFFDKLGGYADKLEEVIMDKAPEAYGALLDLIQFKAAYEIGSGLLFTGIAASLSLFWIKKMLPKAREADEGGYSDGVVTFFGGYVPSIILSVITLVTFAQTISFLNVLGLFYPEGYLALRALQAVNITL
jgi:hypothetical protein